MFVSIRTCLHKSHTSGRSGDGPYALVADLLAAHPLHPMAKRLPDAGFAHQALGLSRRPGGDVREHPGGVPLHLPGWP